MNKAISDSEFKAQYFDRYDSLNRPPAQVIRDLRRLKDLIEQSNRKGLNTVESNEKKELIDKYDMEHVEAFNLEFIES